MNRAPEQSNQHSNQRKSDHRISVSEKSFILRIHLMIEITRILRQRLKSQKLRWKNSASVIKILIN